MSALSFANLMISTLKTAIGVDGSTFNTSTVALARQAISTAITTYLIQNTTITCSYVGVTPGGTPDPIVQDTFKIVGTCPITSSTDFNSWIVELQSCIVSGFSLAPIGTLGVSTSGLPFNPASPLSAFLNQGMLKSYHESHMDAPQIGCWEAVCQSIINWLNAPLTINPASLSLPAVHAAVSTGIASVVLITVV